MIDIKELKRGKFYYIIGDARYENITEGTDNLNCGDRIHNPCGSSMFEKESGGETSWRTDIPWEIREATEEETNWLLACKRAGQYVEKEDSLTYEIY